MLLIIPIHTILTSVTIPEGVTTIGRMAFCGSGLTSVTIPESVTTIDGFAFCGCKSLAAVTIPEGVTRIGKMAFYGYKCLEPEVRADIVERFGNGVFWPQTTD
jgi:hypothetical protein